MDESLKQARPRAVTRSWPTELFVGTLVSIGHSLSAHRAETLAGCLLLLMATNFFTVIARKTITNDETVLIPSAYYHLVAGNFQLVHELPPACKLLAGVPLLFIQPDEVKPDRLAPITDPSARSWAYMVSFWQDNGARFQTISFWTRVPAALLTLTLGILIFRFARELFGARAALWALFLFAFEPTVLAHGRVVQTDIPATFGFLLVCYALYHYMKERTWRRALWVGGGAGLALLGKYSMLIVAPFLVAVLLWLLWRAPQVGERRVALALQAALALLASLFVVNAAYYFHSRALTGADEQWVAASFPSSFRAVWTSVRVLKHLVPTDFVLGIYWQLRHNREGHSASLLGMYSQHGWWYYFPVAFALKTTLPFLLLSLASLGWALYRLIARRERVLLILIVPLLIYTAFVMMSNINIGVRYFLPAYPFLFILGGALLDSLLRLRSWRRVGAAVALLLVCWVGVEAVRVYPDYMSYMNQLAGPRPDWYYLSDSNVEWGDDVGELAEYLRARKVTKVRAALLGGFATLGYCGVEYMDALALPHPERPDTAYVAIGASFLNGSTVPGREGLSEQQRVNFFEQYRARAPEAVFGGSIYLYRVQD
ncbi:MAG TPA: glycosyltransferase family 39 protein [Pyrinomonadaceae bacterium]|jgi:4-amino-4-deoxy-L-arabinose transferase-like glycosyltransferase